MPIRDLTVGIKGAGEMASAIAWRLFRIHVKRLFMMERDDPLAVRRKVAFCEAIWDGRQTVEGVEAVRVASAADIPGVWNQGKIGIMADPAWTAMGWLRPDVLVDATLAKRNLGTTLDEAPLVIGVGPGFTAGRDVHLVVETHRGHHLGRVIEEGTAFPNTGIPGTINGISAERLLRAPVSGRFKAACKIGTRVAAGEVLGHIGGHRVTAAIDGVIRGLIRDGVAVSEGLKLGDIDPRGDISYCETLSEKARAISGGVLEAILGIYNR